MHMQGCSRGYRVQGLNCVVPPPRSRARWRACDRRSLDLTEIPRVTGPSARLLFNAGLRTPEAVAAAHADVIRDILAKGAPTSPSCEAPCRWSPQPSQELSC